ncbi:MAG: DUF2341 domain-containing protein [Candidatus Altiarchaeota archaeon]|nr:DUF2341 domain-containing protein [Candidatus Altiarchaeota archaeon]
MKKLLFFLLYLFILLETTYAAEYNISECSVLNESNSFYYLNASIVDSVNSNCMNISAENITLDCQGNTLDGDFSLNGNSSDNKYAVYSNQHNTTVRNCIISNWQTGIYLDTGANNSLVENNTIQNLYGYKGTDASTATPGGDTSGIYLKSSSNTVFNNTIKNLNAGTGGSSSGNWATGGAGGISAGIHLSYSTGNNIILNNITNLKGGNGGIGAFSHGSGGAGGNSIGIYLSSSAGNNLTSNIASILTGGDGGTGGQWGTGGSGGTAAGVYVLTSINNNLTSGSVSNLTGGKGGNGGLYGSGGVGGLPVGVYLTNSEGNNLTTNQISNLMGGDGGIGWSNGTGGVPVAMWLDTSSYDNILTSLSGNSPDQSKLNTIDGKPILYFYGEIGLNVSNFDVVVSTAPVLVGYSSQTGGISTGLALVNITDSTIYNNTIAGFSGMSRATPGGYSSGSAGGISTGIYLLNSTNNNLTLNAISNITGGHGGTGGNAGSGGAGGTTAGVYLSYSINNKLSSNTILNLTAGTSGMGGSGGASEGAPGTPAAVWFDTSSYDNMITSLSGNSPDQSKLNTIDGRPILYFHKKTNLNISNFNVTVSIAPILIGGFVHTGNPGGAGGTAAGIVLIDVTGSSVYNNTVSGFKGMSGGTGSGSNPGGPGGPSFGVYLTNSTSNNLTSNKISNLTGGQGGTGGCSDDGGLGGTSAGIYLPSSVKNSITSNTISDLTGGTGGTHGYSRLPGSGGTCAGVYLTSSNNSNLTSNAISNLTGGPRGSGGGVGSTAGTSYSLYLYQSNLMTIKENKLEIVDYGFYLYSTSACLSYNNLVNATNPTRFAGTNTNNWNTIKQKGKRIYSDGNLIGGNYWTDSTGTGYSNTCNDSDKDGFCDIQYNLTGDGMNIDFLSLSDESTTSNFSIYLEYPPNQTTINDSNFNFTVKGSKSTYFCELFLNDTIYGINFSTLNNTETTITAIPAPADGIYDWYINCTFGSTTNKSEVREVTMEIPPTTNASAVISNGSPYVFDTVTTSSYVNVSFSCDDGEGSRCDTVQYCVDTTNTCIPNWFFGSWSYRRKITIQNTEGNLSDFQVKIDLTSSNVGPNWNWSNNGNDTRFTYYNVTSGSEEEIPYWIDSWNTTTKTARIWVRVPFIEDDMDTIAYVYYSNPSANAASNGTETFLFFDDFEDGNYSINPNWTLHNQTVSIESVDPISGKYSVKLVRSAVDAAIKTPFYSERDKHILDVKIRLIQAKNSSVRLWFDDGIQYGVFARVQADELGAGCTAMGGCGSGWGGYWSGDVGVHTLRLYWYYNIPSAAIFEKAVFDEGDPESCGINCWGSGNPFYPVYLNRSYIKLSAGGDSVGVDGSFVDDVRVRRYVFSEPDASLGVEEFNAKVQVTAQGTNYVRFRGIDLVGNLEAINSEIVRLTTAPPPTTTTLPGGGDGGGGGGPPPGPTLPSCFDGIQNCPGGECEEGIDCGGPCQPCMSCSDGIQNQGETGVDCGGLCPPCGNCSDGLQNQGESAVDCGGPCPPCASCSDGLQNQGETGIDCGGPCQPCHCFDGVQGDGESGVDCGGGCPPCSVVTRVVSSPGGGGGSSVILYNASSICVNNRKDKAETDIDCGGHCPPCELNKSCVNDSDCLSGWCFEGVCRESNCSDGILGPTESKVDCGGPCGSCPQIEVDKVAYVGDPLEIKVLDPRTGLVLRVKDSLGVGAEYVLSNVSGSYILGYIPPRKGTYSVELIGYDLAYVEVLERPSSPLDYIPEVVKSLLVPMALLSIFVFWFRHRRTKVVVDEAALRKIVFGESVYDLLLHKYREVYALRDLEDEFEGVKNVVFVSLNDAEKNQAEGLAEKYGVTTETARTLVLCKKLKAKKLVTGIELPEEIRKRFNGTIIAGIDKEI